MPPPCRWHAPIYTGVPQDSIKLTDDDDDFIRPSWMPEIDRDFLIAYDFLPPAVKGSDNMWYVLTRTAHPKAGVANDDMPEWMVNGKDMKLTPDQWKDAHQADNNPYAIGWFAWKNGHLIRQEHICKMDAGTLTAMVNYCIKEAQHTWMLDGEDKRSVTRATRLPYRQRSMSSGRYQRMRDMYSRVSTLKAVLDSATAGTQARQHYVKEKEIIYGQYYDLLDTIRTKSNDLECQRADDTNAYSKGEETSYGNTNLSDVLLAEYGVMIKKQNGTDITNEETDAIRQILDAAWKGYHGDLSQTAKKYGLKISYADNVNMHARKAIGLFYNVYHAIGVSFNKDNNQSIDLTRSMMTLSHETAHWLDCIKGKDSHYRYMSDMDGSKENIIANEFRKHFIGHNHLKGYWKRTCECFARAVEEDFALTLAEQTNNPSIAEEIYSQSGYCKKDDFERIRPLVHEVIAENKKRFVAIQKAAQAERKSNLTQEEREYVHSEEFKEKFGDWEKAQYYYDQHLSNIEKGLHIDILTQRMSREKSLETLSNDHDKRLIEICQVPQMQYLDENLEPAKEAIALVKAGQLYVEKRGQEWVMVDKRQTQEVTQANIEETVMEKTQEQSQAASRAIPNAIPTPHGKEVVGQWLQQDSKIAEAQHEKAIYHIQTRMFHSPSLEGKEKALQMDKETYALVDELDLPQNFKTLFHALPSEQTFPLFYAEHNADTFPTMCVDYTKTQVHSASYFEFYSLDPNFSEGYLAVSDGGVDGEYWRQRFHAEGDKVELSAEKIPLDDYLHFMPHYEKLQEITKKYGYVKREADRIAYINKELEKDGYRMVKDLCIGKDYKMVEGFIDHVGEPKRDHYNPDMGNRQYIYANENMAEFLNAIHKAQERAKTVESEPPKVEEATSQDKAKEVDTKMADVKAANTPEVHIADAAHEKTAAVPPLSPSIHDNSPLAKMFVNEAKRLPNIKLEAKLPGKQREAYEEELQKHGWKYAATFDQWYPKTQKALDSCYDFARAFVKRVNRQEEHQIVKVFDMQRAAQHSESDALCKYINSHQGENKPSITSEDAAAMIMLLYKNDGKRIGIDNDGHIGILEMRTKEKSLQHMSIDEIFSAAQIAGKESIKATQKMLEKDNKEGPRFFVPIFTEEIEMLKAAQAKIDAVCKSRNITTAQQQEKPQLHQGYALPTKSEPAIVVTQLGNGVYGVTPILYLTIEPNVAKSLSHEVRALLVPRDGKLAVNDKKNEKYIMKELLEKGICPMKDKQYYADICEAVEMHPLKYAALKENNVENFRDNLIGMARIDNTRDLFAVGNKLTDMATKENRNAINTYLIEQAKKMGYTKLDTREKTQAAMGKLFTSWLPNHGRTEQQKVMPRQAVAERRSI